MSSAPTAQPETLARLRANAARAGLHLSEEDLARIAAGPFLGNVDTFARIVARIPPDTIPNLLKEWRDEGPAGAAAAPAARVAAPATGDPRDPFAPLHV